MDKREQRNGKGGTNSQCADHVRRASSELTLRGQDGCADPVSQAISANPAADKNDIRRAVEILFKVKVDRVNTMNMSGRLRRKRTRHEGRTPRWKKAIVTLKEGDQITLT